MFRSLAHFQISRIVRREWSPAYYVVKSQERFLSAVPPPPPEKKGFFGQLVDNIRQEVNKNKEMKDNIKKFREEAQKLEETEALKKAREKFTQIESETSKGSQQIKEQLDTIKDRLSKTMEEVQQSDVGKKGIEVTEEIAKKAKEAAEAISRQGEQLGNVKAFKAVSQGVRAIREEVDEVADSGSRVYRAPKKLTKRSQLSHHSFTDDKTFEANTEATGVELHKDSKWLQSWENFKENNQYVNKIFDLKVKYDESDNPIVRASRILTDKVSDIFGGLFQKTELSEVLTEICKMDPAFDKNQFLKDCETEIIPNILEAMVRGDLDILKDWCHEAAFNVVATPIRQAQSVGYIFASKVLDISHLDLVMGKIMEQGPVLVITFQSQQIMLIKDSKGNVVEGDPEKILRVQYVWVLCRDQTELDPKAAWKLIDLSASSSVQFM